MRIIAALQQIRTALHGRNPTALQHIRTASQGITAHHSASQGITAHRRASQRIAGHHSTSQGITKYHSASQCITRHHNTFQDITVHHSSVQHSTMHQECPKRLHGCLSGGLRSHVPSVVSRQLTSHMHPAPYKALQRISGHYKVSQRITMHHKTPQPTNPGRNVTKSQKYRGREILQIFLKKTK